MNETLKTITERYSCRSFSDRTLSDEQLKAIAGAVIAAPSAMNGQPWRAIVVKDQALIRDMDAEVLRALAEAEDQSGYQRIQSRGGSPFYHATGMVILTAEPGSELDCGIAIQNAALAASSLGLGNVICGMARLAFLGPKADEFKQKLGMTDGRVFMMSLLIGYADKAGAPHEPDWEKVRFVG